VDVVLLARNGAGPRTSRLVLPAFPDAKDLARLVRPWPGLARLAARAVAGKDFKGDAGETLFLLAPGAGREAQSALLWGLGARQKHGLDGLRRFAGSLARRASGSRADLVLPLDAEAIGTVAGASGWMETAKALAVGWGLGRYAFEAYKSTARRKPRVRLLLAPPRTPGKDFARSEVEHGIRTGTAIAAAANFARDLANTPANDLYPEKLAEHALGLARGGRLRVKVLRKKDLERERMGAILGVAQGSARAPCLIAIEYRPRRRGRATVARGGKAITFDSGGLSIKPAKGMEEMKYDMAGGAAVLGAVLAVSRLEPAIGVVGIIPAAENVISGSAMRPGDVVRSAAGKTIEVINTDAEGRLILADALHYARRYRPDYVLDFATLTGACLVALGSQVSGMVANDRDLGRRVFAAGERAGERVWELPLYEEFLEATKSQVADLKNSAGRNAGAITAAAFLSHFVKGLKWCHLDIAGTAWTEKDGGCFTAGATGVGVRLAVEFVESLEREGAKAKA
jgi:leucyl aminopeptidase